MGADLHHHALASLSCSCRYWLQPGCVCLHVKVLNGLCLPPLAAQSLTEPAICNSMVVSSSVVSSSACMWWSVWLLRYSRARSGVAWKCPRGDLVICSASAGTQQRSQRVILPSPSGPFSPPHAWFRTLGCFVLACVTRCAHTYAVAVAALPM